jgi:uncharacterized membrane protein (DUF4010 family)
MASDDLIRLFTQFGLAAILGFLIGLEREMREPETVSVGIRDFMLFSVLGATSGFAALQYESPWLILAGFAGFLGLLLSSYWAQRDHGPGITTEVSAVLTFFLGVVIMRGATELAVALTILALGVLFPKSAIKRFRSQVQAHEMRAVLLFLTITFIILPVLPQQSLDVYLTTPVGTVRTINPATQNVDIGLLPGKRVDVGSELYLFDRGWDLHGKVEVTEAARDHASGTYRGETLAAVEPGDGLRAGPGIHFLEVMLSALVPYKIWLIVVLVSLISFVGYGLIKVIGSGAGIGLTGLIGGLVSSTVTTLSFARRSTETPGANRLFAMAILLASSVMFPRLILEIAVVNPALMKNIAVPLSVMGLTGFALAGYLYRRSRAAQTEAPTVAFDNPFSLKSAVSFALVFAAILMFTRLATTYLGNAWLPAVALVSGLTDADAIAFSLSSLQRAGLVHIDWASFNLVLGALSNTFMKLFLVFGLGHRELFKHLLLSFLVIGAVGLVTMFLYYDLAAALPT